VTVENEPGKTIKAALQGGDEPGMDFAVPVSNDVKKQICGDEGVRDEGPPGVDLTAVLGEWSAAMRESAGFGKVDNRDRCQL
jgi:hypothetical protein